MRQFKVQRAMREKIKISTHQAPSSYRCIAFIYKESQLHALSKSRRRPFCQRTHVSVALFLWDEFSERRKCSAQPSYLYKEDFQCLSVSHYFLATLNLSRLMVEAIIYKQ